MNYRHAFHAGNFADLLKHAVLTDLLAALTAAKTPLTVIDTHAGAGLYDLGGEAALKTGEGAAISRLMSDPASPAVFDALKAAVLKANRGPVRYYPGSPLIVAGFLRPRDQLVACELRADDHGLLKNALPRELGAEALKEDGWAVVARRAPRAPAAVLALIDPPFERGDDYAMAAAATQQVLARNPAAVIAVWTPIKDLATFDDFLGRMEDAAGRCPILVAQARLRALTDPMSLNGCAMVVANPTPGLAHRAGSAAAWIAKNLGDAGALGRAEMIRG